MLVSPSLSSSLFFLSHLFCQLFLNFHVFQCGNITSCPKIGDPFPSLFVVNSKNWRPTNSNWSRAFCVGAWASGLVRVYYHVFPLCVQRQTPVPLKGQYPWPQDQIDFMCHHLLTHILPLTLFHFWTITFLLSGLFFPEFLIAFFYLFAQKKLGLCHPVPMI